MQIAVTKMSSKGQVVIPAEMREGIHEGEQIVIIKNDGQFIMKKVGDIDKNFKKEIESAGRTWELFAKHNQGRFV